MSAPLSVRISTQIRAAGPMSIAAYMAICLGDPEEGYYMSGDPFGKEGDFVTAPEVSQMFGELIGLWSVTNWLAIDSPSPVNVVELGPGRGTLMADFLRAASLRPDFINAADVHMVEMSPALKEMQQRTLDGAPIPPRWHENFDDVPDGPLVLVANEFFDALPIHQYEMRDGVWRERVVGFDDEGELAFGLGAGTLDAADVPPLRGPVGEGSVIETRPAGTAIMQQIAARIVAHGGLALIIDYGHAESAPGNTLQAVGEHEYADPLEKPGEVDLTAHVDFGALKRAAEAAGAAVHGPLVQGEFLLRLGLLERAGSLGAKQEEEVQNKLRAEVERLAGSEQMGTLFKVMAVSRPGLALQPFGG
ncbi:MAG: methyltransferase [Hyphomicrobiales bacterium]|nr:MAG: methyltransferase [Hyphomicrobiales bacterium]